MLALVRQQADQAGGADADRLLEAILVDPISEHVFAMAGLPQVVSTWTYSACSSALHALALACLELECDEQSVVEVCVCGGDALSGIGAGGFWRAGATSPTQCTPFREPLDGILVAEGAAALRLTPSSDGRDTSDVEIRGFGMSCDAGHPTLPDRDGRYLERAVRQALADAGIAASDVAAVVAHGTGTNANDHGEAVMLRRVFGDAAVPVTSIKGSLGHTMGASGLFNLFAAVSTLRCGWLPPAGRDRGSTVDGIDLVVGRPRPIDRHALILTICSGFGGNNVALVVHGERP
jgi:3-oxoacyl-(acyl-carrier-protein) synthase